MCDTDLVLNEQNLFGATNIRQNNQRKANIQTFTNYPFKSPAVFVVLLMLLLVTLSKCTFSNMLILFKPIKGKVRGNLKHTIINQNLQTGFFIAVSHWDL